MRQPFSFSWLPQSLGALGSYLQPPQWLQEEIQHRAVLFLNHLLMQEPQAQERLVRQSGRTVRAQWRQFVLQLRITPAGLLELAPEAVPELTLTVTESSPGGLAQEVLRGHQPAVRIEGDVQFAADVNWVVDNVRWDVEHDLSRVVGDRAAHAAASVARSAAEALRQFVARFSGQAKAGP